MAPAPRHAGDSQAGGNGASITQAKRGSAPSGRRGARPLMSQPNSNGKRSMAKLTFKNSRVRRCVEHASNSKSFRNAYEQKATGPSLWLVKDDGIYVMSNGFPADAEGERNYVVYAEGFDPRSNPNVWEDCRDAVGGDDFCEVIPLYSLLLEDILRHKADLLITVSTSELRVGVLFPSEEPTSC